MELTIIDTSAYQELRKLVSTLAAQKRLPRPHWANEWMRRKYVWHWAYLKDACKTIGITDLSLT